MAWICEVCSTSNESKDKICFVCESPRSKASLMAEKAEERRKREERFYGVISTYMRKVERICGGGVRLVETLGIILVIAILIVRFREGRVSDIVPSLVNILSCCLLKIGLLWRNIKNIAAIVFAGILLKVHVAHLGVILLKKMQIMIANIQTIIQQIIQTVGTAIQRGIK